MPAFSYPPGVTKWTWPGGYRLVANDTAIRMDGNGATFPISELCVQCQIAFLRTREDEMRDLFEWEDEDTVYLPLCRRCQGHVDGSRNSKAGRTVMEACRECCTALSAASHLEGRKSIDMLCGHCS